MSEDRLHVFISYASEDRDLATAIGEELRRAFNPAVLKVTIDVEISLGDNWRERLKVDLDETDILLVVATGKEKVSHSFTGFEVGYFDSSIRHSPKMANFSDQDRIMIPIAVFTKTPETLSEIEALQISDPMLVDTAALKNAPGPLSGDRKNPISKLFKRIQGIISPPGLTDDELETIDKQLLESASRLIDVVYGELRKRVYQDNFPERKIIIRTEGAGLYAQPDSALSKATVEFFGRFDSFGFEASEGKVVPWSGFVANIGQEEIARRWTDTLQMLVSDAVRGDFRENRQIVTSRDKDRAFRMFVARSVIYYSGAHEIHIYVVEIKYKDFGDPTTTMLLKAISVGLQYRFMFLEGMLSEYSPEAFSATLQDQVRAKIAEMIQQLDYLLWYSQEAGLEKPANILQILGNVQPGEIDGKSVAWEDAKAKLHAAAQTVLASKDDPELLRNKIEFVRVLKRFCDDTKAVNEEFTAKVLLALGRIVSNEKDSMDTAA